MNLYLTFCSGVRCPVTETCERSTLNLSRWFKEHPEHKGKSEMHVSVAEFSPPEGGKCERYESTNERKER